MNDSEFELLLAMLRLLKLEDRNSSTVESAVVNILDAFEPHFAEHEKKILLKEFVRYESALQKNKSHAVTRQRIDEEERRRIVSDYFSRDFGW